jgi:hypothetical protein
MPLVMGTRVTYASIAPAVVPAMREWTGFSFLELILWELKAGTKGGNSVAIKSSLQVLYFGSASVSTVLGEHA